MSDHAAFDPLGCVNPSDVAERAVLGAILQDAGLIAVASDIIGPEDFEAPRYGRVFATMLALYAGNTPPDIVMLTSEDPALDTVQLADLMADFHGPGYLRAYCEQIAKASRARKMQTIGALIVQAAAR